MLGLRHELTTLTHFESKMNKFYTGVQTYSRAGLNFPGLFAS